MSESLLSRIKRTARLPSPPGTALQILQLCQKPDLEIGELADTIAADPALSLRLLKYANSPFVGVRREVTSVRSAVILLGIRSVRLMALSFSLISSNDGPACRGFDFGRFWSHSAACALSARRLARRAGRASSEEAFAAGLLAHIGKLVFAVCLPDQYTGVLRAAGGQSGDTGQYEPEHMGSTHEALGGDLLDEWGVPARLGMAVRYQNDAGALEDEGLCRLAATVGTASVMADIVCEVAGEELLAERWERLIGESQFASQEEARSAIETVRGEYDELDGILSLRKGTADNAEEIEAEAGEVRDELGLAEAVPRDADAEQADGGEAGASRDAVTGLHDRATFDRKLQEVWDDLVASGRPIGLIMLEVDHFKRYNGRRGRQTADTVLEAVARCLRQQIRGVDLAARYESTVFTVIAPNLDRLTAAQLCVKIRKAVERMTVEAGSEHHRVTVSIGAALLQRPDAPFNPAELVDVAGSQLERARQSGRNCCSMKQLKPRFEQASV